MQMRLLANFSGDPELVKAFQEEKDVHWLTVEMCGIQGSTDKEKRDRAKEVNFGRLFQMTALGLAQKLGTDIVTAAKYHPGFLVPLFGCKTVSGWNCWRAEKQRQPKRTIC